KPGVGADRGFRTVADREHRAGELRLGEREEKVRLVLRRVETALEDVASGLRTDLVFAEELDSCVMTRGNGLSAKRLGALGERGELQVAVAVGAGQRRATGDVFVDEVRDDLLLKLALEVEHV